MNARALLCLPLLAAGLFAQTSDKPKLSIRFRALAFDEAIPNASYLEGETLRRLTIPNNAFTPEVTYKGSNTLRFITIDEETLNPRPLSPEMSAAIQRLRRAQAVTLQASDEYAQITRLLDTLNLQTTERAGKASAGDLAQIEALNGRLRELSGILSAASKETEEANLLILRLEAAPRPPPKEDKKKGGKAPKPTSTPTAEYTFQKDGSYLLLFSSGGNGHQILALDDAEGAFPYGAFQFINLTGKDVELRYPDRKVALRANARTVVKNPASDHQYALAEIHTRADDGYEVGHVYRSLQQPNVRSLVFLLPIPDEPHAIRSKTIEDRRPAEPAGTK
ncbi:MAG: hypothetical protein RL592_738 [Verrucomicrobiota bacterium]|jgi:hypothetical protein|nr:hypothetical protein [Verrucomicrobiota bacterium]